MGYILQSGVIYSFTSEDFVLIITCNVNGFEFSKLFFFFFATLRTRTYALYLTHSHPLPALGLLVSSFYHAKSCHF